MQFPERHNNHTLEQKSETFVRKYLPQDWNVTRPSNDYGQDLNLEICEGSQYKGLDLIIQLKSSAQSDLLDNTERQQLKVSTYNYLNGNLRVVMIIKYIEAEDEAYWILLKDIAPPNSESQENFTIKIPTANKISKLDWSEITAYVRGVTDEKLRIRNLAASLEKVRKELEATQNEVLKSKNVISQLSSTLQITFSGNWTESPYFGYKLSPVNDECYLIFTSSDENGFIKFYASETYYFREIDNGKVLFSCKMAVVPGDKPLGEDYSTLQNYKAILAYLPLLLYNNLTERAITLHEITIDIIINNTIKKRYSFQDETRVDVNVLNNDQSCAWAIINLICEENESILDSFQ